MKFLLIAFLILDTNNTETILHEVPSEKACEGYARQVGDFRNLSVTRISRGSADGFLTFNQRSLRFKCVPLDDSGTPERH